MKHQLLTCADKHDIILPIGSVDSVHSYLCEAVVHISPDKDGPSAHGVNWIIHEGVVTSELDHIVWETLCGLKTAKSLAGTLKEDERGSRFTGGIPSLDTQHTSECK